MATMDRKEYITSLRTHIADQIRKIPPGKKPKNLQEWIDFNNNEKDKHMASLIAQGTTVDKSHKGPKT